MNAMSWAFLCLAAVGWFVGIGDIGDGRGWLHDIAGIQSPIDSGTLNAQTPVPENRGAEQGTPIGGNEQNWGAMIVFAIGIGLFIAAYMYFRQTPAPKKKKRKKF